MQEQLRQADRANTSRAFEQRQATEGATYPRTHTTTHPPYAPLPTMLCPPLSPPI
mgnify:CR=1 FL=1